MTQRLYPQPTTNPPITPAFAAAWNATGGMNRRLLLPTRVDNSSSATNFAGTGVANQNRGMWQFLRGPLAPQTLGGTIKGQFRCNETNAGVDQYYMQMGVFVWSGDGLTLRGTGLALHANALSSEWAAALTNRKNPLAALSPANLAAITIQAGDWVVVEVGFRQASAAVANGAINVRDNNASDLPEDEASVSTFNSWIEFSQDLLPIGAVSGGKITLGIDMGL